MSIPEPLQQVARTFVRWNGRKLSYFAGCDYFRLASHPKVLKAARMGLKKYGLNVAASRLTTGNHALFGKLETALAQFFASEAAVLVSNGYVTNLVVAQAIAGEFTHVLIDEKAHPSLKDAAQILGGTLQTFRHRSNTSFAEAAAKLPKSARVIALSDGMFSHDGGIAPLKSYLKVLPKGGILLVDDAHGAGTLGGTGKGTVELEELPRKRIIQTITLSKAFGCYGGAILCSRELREKIIAKSRMFVGNTPLPLPMANAALIAVQLLEKHRTHRKHLQRNINYVRERLVDKGYPVEPSVSPILPIIPKDKSDAERIRANCLDNGVFPSFIKYPGGPQNGYFRFVISSHHSAAQLRSLVSAITDR